MAEAKHLPGVEKTGFLHKKVPVEAVGGLPPLVIAGVSAYKFFLDPATVLLGWLSVGAVIWLVGATVLKVLNARELDRETASKGDHDGLRGALWVLHSAASHACNLGPAVMGQQLRVTFHRVMPPLDKAEKIQQLTPYVGGGNNGKGREFSVRSGITGKAIREKSVYTICLESNDEQKRRKELKEDWGYTDHDLKSLSMDRLSSMAIPVLDPSGHHALGVIYLDSDQKDLFASADVQAAIIVACNGITKYVTERYSK